MPGYARRSYRKSASHSRPYRRTGRATGGRRSYGGRRTGGRVTRGYVKSAIARNENKKHGLQTVQDSVPFSNTVSGINGVINVFPMWSAQRIVNAGIFATGSDTKQSIRSMQQTILITNQSNVWVHCKVAKVRFRKILTELFAPLLFLLSSNSYTPQNQPYGDMTTSTTFRRFAKILSNKTKIIRPGGILRLHRKSFHPRGKVFTGQVEGNSAIAAYPGMYATYIQFVSMPYAEKAPEGGTTGDIGPVEIYIAGVMEQKITYHHIEDAVPLSINLNNTRLVNQTFQYNVAPTELNSAISMLSNGYNELPSQQSRVIVRQTGP